MRDASFVLALCLAASGCMNPLEPSGAKCPGFYPGDTRACIALTLKPQTDPYGWWILKGDTARLFTYSDYGHGMVSWSIVGAGAFVASSELTTTVDGPSSTVVVKGVRVGATTITASNAGTSLTATSTITVFDSASVTRIRFESLVDGAPFYLGSSALGVGASLITASGRPINGVPDMWATSDSSIAVITLSPVPPCLPAGLFYLCSSGPAAFLQTKARGPVTITAGFRNVRASINVVVR